MLVTVTNTSGGTINNLITGGSGVSSDAVGGSKNTPLPYPFGHIGSLANGANKQLPMPTGATSRFPGCRWSRRPSGTSSCRPARSPWRSPIRPR
jgi:hypothetical protein